MGVIRDDFALFQDEDLGGGMGDSGPFGNLAGEGSIILNDERVNRDFGVFGGEALHLGLGGPADMAGAAVFEQDRDFLFFDFFEVEGGRGSFVGFGQPVEHLLLYRLTNFLPSCFRGARYRVGRLRAWVGVWLPGARHRAEFWVGCGILLAMAKTQKRRIGIHTSTSGALYNAATKAMELGANCFQIFSGSPRTWAAPAPKPEAVAKMAELRAAHDLRPLVIHANYLINLCSADAANRPKSIAAFRGELERAVTIGAEYLVVHPGSAKDHEHRDGAIAAFAAGLAESSQGLAVGGVSILLENTAGHGNLLGGELADLRAIRDLAAPHVAFPIGYCLDTCHSFAAGYEITTEAGLKAFIGEAEELLGLENVPVFHANDSKGELGSHLDRHANIGEGYIGIEAFRRILNARPLRDKAFILETPIDNDGDDLRNVEALWSLIN